MATTKKPAEVGSDTRKRGKLARSKRPTGKAAKAEPVRGRVLATAPTRASAIRKARYELRSKVTQRGQTTLPSGVRQALRVKPGEELEYTIQGEEVIITRVSVEKHDDPLIAGFLSMLERDIQRRPQRMVPASPGLEERIRRLTGGLRPDPDESIDGEVAL